MGACMLHQGLKDPERPVCVLLSALAHVLMSHIRLNDLWCLLRCTYARLHINAHVYMHNLVFISCSTSCLLSNCFYLALS